MSDIAKLREQIAAGRYRVDAASIASALLGHAGIEETASLPAPDSRRPVDHVRPDGSPRPR